MSEKEKKEFMDYIGKHPKFKSGGTLDGDFFYTQSDGSFFDPEGFYFNAEGFDEAGGYYDDYGTYRDADYDHGDELPEEEETHYTQYLQTEHTANLIAAIEGSSSDEFDITLANLPYTAKQEDIEKELAAKGIKYQKISCSINSKHQLLKADLHIKGKPEASAIVNLHGKEFLTRSLKVEFPDFLFGEGPSVVGENLSVSVSSPAPPKISEKPVPEEKPKVELKKEEEKGKGKGKEGKETTTTVAPSKIVAQVMEDEDVVIESFKEMQPFKAEPRKYAKKAEGK